jgi:transposase
MRKNRRHRWGTFNRHNVGIFQLTLTVATDDTILPLLQKGKTAKARMWVYIGDVSPPYNVFDSTLDRSRNGPLRFLKVYDQVLLADAYGGYNGVVAGN